MLLPKLIVVVASLSLNATLAFGTDIKPGEALRGSLAVTAATGYSAEQMRGHQKNWDHKAWDLIHNETLRYAHLNTEQFFKAERVSRLGVGVGSGTGSGAVSHLEKTIRPELGAVKAQTFIGELNLDTWLKTGPVDGYIVLHKGEIIYEQYPRMRPSDKHLWWSTRKSIIGTLVAMLEEEGKIDVNKSIDTYIADLKNTAWAGIPIIDILDMASGTAAIEADEPNAFTDEKTYYYQFEATNGSRPALTTETTKDFVKRLPVHRKSGEAYEYTTVDTFVLGWLVEEITGLTQEALISQRIWQHIGAESDALVSVAKTGEGILFSSTLRDMARYSLLFTPSWSKVSKTKIISDSYLKKIQHGGRPEIFAKATVGQIITSVFEGDPVSHNTYQWDFVMPDGDFSKLGHNGQGIYISPGKDVVVAFFGSGDDTSIVVSLAVARAIAKSLVEDDKNNRD